MTMENYTSSVESVFMLGEDRDVIQESITDVQEPNHILDQYAKVRREENKKENKLYSITDSGKSLEGANADEVKFSKANIDTVPKNTENIVNLEKRKSDLESEIDLFAPSEEISLEFKNPHVLTDSLKKALKKPLPPGPPPKKPPRVFVAPSTTSSYSVNDLKESLSDGEMPLTHVTNDPGRKLHRRNARKYIRSLKKNASAIKRGSCTSYLQLTDALKKTLPLGPPPKKPPRTLVVPSNESDKSKKDPKKVLDKFFSLSNWKGRKQANGM